MNITYICFIDLPHFEKNKILLKHPQIRSKDMNAKMHLSNQNDKICVRNYGMHLRTANNREFYIIFLKDKCTFKD